MARCVYKCKLALIMASGDSPVLSELRLTRALHRMGIAI